MRIAEARNAKRAVFPICAFSLSQASIITPYFSFVYDPLTAGLRPTGLRPMGFLAIPVGLRVFGLRGALIDWRPLYKPTCAVAAGSVHWREEREAQSATSLSIILLAG
jgi:hypothetical protein